MFDFGDVPWLIFLIFNVMFSRATNTQANGAVNARGFLITFSGVALLVLVFMVVIALIQKST